MAVTHPRDELRPRFYAANQLPSVIADTGRSEYAGRAVATLIRTGAAFGVRLGRHTERHSEVAA
jgi:hypothetical protein